MYGKRVSGGRLQLEYVRRGEDVYPQAPRSLRVTGDSVEGEGHAVLVIPLAGKEGIGVERRTDLLRLLAVDDSAHDAVLVLKCDVLLRLVHQFGRVPQEEIAARLEVDVVPQLVGHMRPHLLGFPKQGDLIRPGELGTNALTTAAGGTAAQVALLQNR